MLTRAHRLVSGDDYRRLVRRGRRSSTQHTVVYVTRSQTDTPVRFGFIIPKTVGVAVKRNLVRRRLKSLSHDALPNIAPGTDVVIRALPGAAQLTWDTLRAEISAVFEKGVTTK